MQQFVLIHHFLLIKSITDEPIKGNNIKISNIFYKIKQNLDILKNR